MANGDDNSKRLSEVCRRIDELKASALKDAICAENVQDDVHKALRAARKIIPQKERSGFFAMKK